MIVSVLVLDVLPSLHSTNLYPSLGVAVIVTLEPVVYVPEPLSVPHPGVLVESVSVTPEEPPDPPEPPEPPEDPPDEPPEDTVLLSTIFPLALTNVDPLRFAVVWLRTVTPSAA